MFQFRTHKVIYRRYAGLFFSLCVDITDNELAYLECIHLFVEILDHFFSNVCELDLVFNFHKVCLFLMFPNVNCFPCSYGSFVNLMHRSHVICFDNVFDWTCLKSEEPPYHSSYDFGGNHTWNFCGALVLYIMQYNLWFRSW